MDKSKIRTEFNQRVMGCIYDQVPKRVAEVLSIADPKGRNKHLVEKERRIQDCMKDFDPH